MKKILLILFLVFNCASQKDVALQDLKEIAKKPQNIFSLKENSVKNRKFQAHIASKQDYGMRSLFPGMEDAKVYIPVLRKILKDAKEFEIPMIVFGDSNSYGLTNDVASAYALGDSVGGVANIGIIGTTATDWLEIFENAPDILLDIQSFKYQVVSIGGNHVIKEKMNVLERDAKIFYSKFPRSILLDLPKYTGIKEEEKQRDIIVANKILLSIWKENYIDTYSASLQSLQNGEIVFFDGYHTLDSWDLVNRIPAVLGKIYIQKISSGDL